jgi:DNA-binding NtrC family response regulator
VTLAPHLSATAVKNPAAIRVLVVDDEPLIRWSLAEALTDRGLIVSEAGNAREALFAVTREEPAERPHVVLLDYRLPDSNDLGLLTAIKKHAPDIEVVLMTAFATSEVVTGANRLGAYAVMIKPFDILDLATLVETAHRSHELGYLATILSAQSVADTFCRARQWACVDGVDSAL